ncbi:hypothetical protein Taro_039870 [Colocasia esculenta]|uniref:peptidylprolyl isomerase n=1 Tax=Colocasia esculenta TaxID=4460 RepID=A0A843WSR9_COLES|nr:hypothetical protein [Colocasia esculenta]
MYALKKQLQSFTNQQEKHKCRAQVQDAVKKAAGRRGRGERWGCVGGGGRTGFGVEVKPGRPFVHTYITESGPLRLSQATLGIGTATERSVLQCNVGDKAPVLLCSLLPNRIESTCMDLEFGEKGAVVFSVIGPRSVHLAGYFLTASSRRGGGDANESESFGEDIWDTGSNQSGSYGSTEDKYESDFIDDGDIGISPSPRCDSGAVVKDVIEEEKPVNGNRAHRRLRKKHQISDSDEEAVGPQDQIDGHKKSPVSESEEEDGFPISFSLRNRDKKKKIDEDVRLDSKVLDVDKKGMLVVKDEDLEREDEVVAVSSGKLKKNKDRIKSRKPLEIDTVIPVKDIRDKQSKNQSKCAYDEGDEPELCEGQNVKVNQDLAHEVVLTENNAVPKKKKKGKVRRGETEARGDLMVDKCEEGACIEKIDTIGNIEQANIGDDDKHTVVKSGGQGIHDEKEALGSHDKLKRKKKKTKGKSYVEEENTLGETLQKDGNDKNQMMEVVQNKAPRSRKKRDKDQTVCEQHPETTANVNEEPSLDVCHETNEKKRRKNR